MPDAPRSILLIEDDTDLCSLMRDYFARYEFHVDAVHDGLMGLARAMDGGYELIILDSPPVMEVADALTLADHVDSVVFIAACKSTLRRTAQEALRRFASTGKQVAGVVLTKAPVSGPAKTSYAGYAA